MLTDHIPCRYIRHHLDHSSAAASSSLVIGFAAGLFLDLFFIYRPQSARAYWNPNPNEPNAPDEEGSEE